MIYIPHAARCMNCDYDWKGYSVEWPPQLLMCPVCSEMMWLVKWDEEEEKATFVRKGTYRRRHKHD